MFKIRRIGLRAQSSGLRVKVFYFEMYLVSLTHYNHKIQKK